jgi:hypothetical protein
MGENGLVSYRGGVDWVCFQSGLGEGWNGFQSGLGEGWNRSTVRVKMGWKPMVHVLGLCWWVSKRRSMNKIRKRWSHSRVSRCSTRPQEGHH